MALFALLVSCGKGASNSSNTSSSGDTSSESSTSEQEIDDEGMDDIPDIVIEDDPFVPQNLNFEERILSYNVGIGLHDVLFASKIYERLESDNIPYVDIVKETDKFWI